MSAFVVSHAHIDALVWARREYFRDGAVGTLAHTTDTDLGRALLRENMISTACRYPDYADMQVDEPKLAAYVYLWPTRHYSHAEILKAIHCYEYQACEHGDAWETSDARAYCRKLESKIVRALPGYDKAAWSIDDDARAA